MRLEQSRSTPKLPTTAPAAKTPDLFAVEESTLDHVALPRDDHSRLRGAPDSSTEAMQGDVLLTVVAELSSAPVADSGVILDVDTVQVFEPPFEPPGVADAVAKPKARAR